MLHSLCYLLLLFVRNGHALGDSPSRTGDGNWHINNQKASNFWIWSHTVCIVWYTTSTAYVYSQQFYSKRRVWCYAYLNYMSLTLGYAATTYDVLYLPDFEV